MRTALDGTTEVRRQMIEQWLAVARAGKEITISAINAGFEVWMQQVQAQAKIAEHVIGTWMEVGRRASQGRERTS